VATLLFAVSFVADFHADRLILGAVAMTIKAKGPFRGKNRHRARFLAFSGTWPLSPADRASERQRRCWPFRYYNWKDVMSALLHDAAGAESESTDTKT
jgi:hypothetical protein